MISGECMFFIGLGAGLDLIITIHDYTSRIIRKVNKYKGISETGD